MLSFAQKLINDESGATAIEYGLIAALIAIGLVGAVTGLRDELSQTFNEVGTTLDNQQS
jgi:pilus assembly protein Flp/PilA